MFQVVVLPPTDSMRTLEEFRRIHDPAFHRIAAHLPLLAPFDAADDALVGRFDALRLGTAFDVEFGAPVASGRALCLPVARGEAEVRALRATLAAALLGPVGAPPDAAPAVRAGLFGGDAELELARRALATLPPTAPWHVAEISLVLEDVRGLWHDVRRRRLAPR